MADHHGSSPAAWTAVILVLLGFFVGGAGMLLDLNWVIFTVGCVLIVLGGLAGKIMSAAGMGAK